MAAVTRWTGDTTRNAGYLSTHDPTVAPSGVTPPPPPPAETYTGGWVPRRRPAPRYETDADREARIKAERVRMGIIEPDALPLDAAPPWPSLPKGGVGGGAINRHEPRSAPGATEAEIDAAFERAGLHAASHLDKEIARYLTLIEARRRHRLREETEWILLFQ